MTEKRYELLHWASDFLKAHRRDENIGELLLQARLGVSRTKLIADLRESVTKEDARWIREKVIDHAQNGTPVQYILGMAPFYGRTFKVTPDVLIPRPETEELVWRVGRWVKQYFPERRQLSVCDIGTGSGAIAVTLALEHPDWHVTAVDLSEKALMVARNNAAALHAHVTFRQGDLLQPLQGEAFDILVSNPPYISKKEMSELDDIVGNYEPHMALFGGADGLDFYRKIIQHIPEISRPHDLFMIAFEIGALQGAAVSDLIRRAYANRIEALAVEKDISGLDRNVIAVLRTSGK
ncbi:peptide chain release factor N(5)-glutamine methyltransferase [Sporolactobacillus sp. CPB3-1]|uniref:Release factor glutamine methyltransferase n=1 Tax=Sporolactobacillus mangiferae TaxID=2940498 RepID=A0ABT0M8S5_9BACL|nr:peptide chain release factor N(5)-glutamine methyltransferase [Sporolactobacillus mangiferae]